MTEYLVWQVADGGIEVRPYVRPTTPPGGWVRWALIPADGGMAALRWALRQWRKPPPK